jgi:hypothetical protein
VASLKGAAHAGLTLNLITGEKLGQMRGHWTPALKPIVELAILSLMSRTRDQHGQSHRPLVNHQNGTKAFVRVGRNHGRDRAPASLPQKSARHRSASDKYLRCRSCERTHDRAAELAVLAAVEKVSLTNGDGLPSV